MYTYIYIYIPKREIRGTIATEERIFFYIIKIIKPFLKKSKIKVRKI